MRTRSMILIIMFLLGILILCCCSNEPSKAAEMNRLCDSTYKADSAAIADKYAK